MSVRTFPDLGVPGSLVEILTDHGITIPTPIQAATLPDSFAGRDVLGRGRTGSGKTYAFLLPLVARLAESGRRPAPKRPRALILAPTRELVSQIEASLAPLAQATNLRTRTIFGGVGQNPQVQALAKGVDIVIACPGRLEDLMKQGACALDNVEITILDEADHMADLGFLPSVRRILDATPKNTQRMLFSATLDNAVNVLVKRFMTNPVTHEADSAQSPVAKMDHHVLHLQSQHKLPVLVDLTSAPGRTVVFTRTKRGAKNLTRQLNSHGVPTVELHGNLAQNARTRNMEAFHSGRATTLVATDIAARGIHVDDVALVIHADPPAEHKAYLHRSGRTARAGSAGIVVTLMTNEQVRDVRDLTRAAGIRPTTTQVNGANHPLLAELAPGARTLTAGGLALETPAQTTSGRAPRSGNGRWQPQSEPRPGSGPERQPEPQSEPSFGHVECLGVLGPLECIQLIQLIELVELFKPRRRSRIQRKPAVPPLPMIVRKAVARGALRAAGWDLTGEVPSAGILVGAPHTSKWDWLVMLLIAWSSGARPQVLVKHTFFKGPIGWALRRTGGIELDRENPGATIRALLKEAEGDKPFLLVIAPKGTRSKVDFWKPGFYRIAKQTGLPISLGFVDGPTKRLGIGPSFHPTDDVVADMDVVRAFYADKLGIRPENRTEPRLREETDPERGIS